MPQRYRVIALDRPGLGHSDTIGDDTANPLAQADILHRACETRWRHAPDVLGHSYGGAVAMAWALTAPEQYRHLGHPVWGDDAMARRAWPLVSHYRQPAGRGFGHSAGDRLRLPCPHGRRAFRNLRSRTRPEAYGTDVGVPLTMRRQTLRANARQVNSLKQYLIPLAQRYPELTMPVEIVHGDTDTIVPHHIHAEPLAQRLRHAALTLLPGAGHMPHHTHPEEVIAAIDRAAARARLR